MVLAACGDSTPPLETAVPGIVFTYPVDAQVDVPLGTRIVVVFSDPVVATALGSCSAQGSAVTGAFCLVGPNGVVGAMPMVGSDEKTVEFAAADLDPGATYGVYVGAALAPTAANIPASGRVTQFTTRTSLPKSAAPALVAVDGADPTHPDSFRPLLQSSTIRLLFSEPLDMRTVALAPGALELDDASGTEVPATLLADGIHVSIDPVMDLAAGTTYTLKVGTKLLDLGGQSVTAMSVPLTPLDSSGGNAPIPQVLRTRGANDPGQASPRTGAPPNVIDLNKPLIGDQTTQLMPSTLAAELGDPKSLGGPIAFTIRRGARLASSGLDVKLGGVIPAGLSTGDIEIELISDSGGRIYRNPNQAASQVPENDRAPLYVDLSMDVAVYAIDPEGNAVLSQTVMGIQGAGIVAATDGVLDIETVASMELGLLGVTAAPSNLVLELITDQSATPAVDTTAPTLIASYPRQNAADHPVGAGVELIFSEPIDLDRARAGGVALQTSAGATVASEIESHGSAIVVRPITKLAYSTGYQVVLADVADVAGNKLPATNPIAFSTPALAGTSSPMTATAVHPGVACALVGGTASSPGRCAGGQGGDDLYAPFTLAASEPIQVAFDAPVSAASIALGTACNAGSVRVEIVNASGACTGVVPGALVPHDRALDFYPDSPWVAGALYRLTLVSGNNSSCNAGDICGLTSDVSFDPLNGTSGNGASGGPSLVATFTGAAATAATYMLAETGPFTDVNGSGTVDGVETTQDANRTALRIVNVGGLIDNANFNGNDCISSTPDIEPCIYLAGAMPVEMQPIQMSCALPDGSMAASCMPVTISAEVMYGTSVSLNATVSGVFTITNPTGTTVIRTREPSNGPITGYIIDDNGMPTMMVALDLYMDAPDLSITLSSHDLHSKPLSVSLEGPVTFLPDGRIAIAVANTADVPLTINISTDIVGDGNVDLLIPQGEMKLQLLSRALRGAPQ